MGEKPVITQEMIQAYDDFTHLTLDRRAFMDKLTKLAGSAAAAAAIAPMIGSNYANAETIPANDPRIKADNVTYKGPAGDLKGYLATPAGVTGKVPAVLVLAQNRGLNPHIKDVVRRVALEGYVALGVDMLSRLGGTPDNDDAAGQLFAKLDPAGVVPDMLASTAYLRGHPQSTGVVGTVGFCVGGSHVNLLASADPQLRAGVAYYGPQPPADAAKTIKAKMMFHYAELDTRITGAWPAWKEALNKAGVFNTTFIYSGVNHAFNDDTTEARYNKSVADLAWTRTVLFFKTYLS